MRIAISGINRGIGEGLARGALRNGDAVLGFGRGKPSWADDAPARLTFHECDMADHVALAAICSQVTEAIDVLICSAATFANGAGTIEAFHPKAMTDAFAVNVVAPLIMASKLRRNLEAGERRLIIMMSTGNASLQGNTTGSLLGYRISKSALNQAVRNLAAEWGPQGFTTVALNPGWVKTDMGGPNAETSVDDAAAHIFSFIHNVSTTQQTNGCFLNTDGSPLPW